MEVIISIFNMFETANQKKTVFDTQWVTTWLLLKLAYQTITSAGQPRLAAIAHENANTKLIKMMRISVR